MLMKTTRKKISKLIKCISVLLLAAFIICSAVYLRYFPGYILNTPSFDISEQEQEPSRMTVMSFNIRCWTPFDTGKKGWPYRAELVINNIEKAAPDIIGFQEVKKWQYSFLNKALSGYDNIIEYRDDTLFTEGCPIYFRTDKYDLIEKGFFWLSETPEVMSKDWNSACYRICSYVILSEKSKDNKFVVFNTHLDHVSDEARTKGIGVVLDKISQFGSLPAILMGDLNATEKSQTYQMATDNFLDVKYQTDNTMQSSTYQNWGTALNRDCIDYILVSKSGISTERYYVMTDTYDSVYPSDHFPVCAELLLGDEE